MVYLQLLLLCASFLLEPFNCKIYGVLDCKWTSKGTYYRGSVSRTKNGTVCRYWEATNCDECHYGNREIFRNAGLEANYCRNPEGDSGGPWCYTVAYKDKSSGSPYWEYCKIPDCTVDGVRGKKLTVELKSQLARKYSVTPGFFYLTPFLPTDRVCLEHREGKSYRGPYGLATSTLAKGLKVSRCMKWEDLTDTQVRPSLGRFKHSGLKGRTCRNPDNGNRPWCYVMKIGWDYCKFAGCHIINKKYIFGEWKAIDCSKSHRYRGTMSTTESGHTCLHWRTMTNENVNPFIPKYRHADLRENYCRNPDGAHKTWCYYEYRTYDYCNIPECP